MKFKLSRILTFTLLGFILNGCASMPGMPGNIIENVSSFDGSKELTMEPAWLYDSSIKLSLYQNTKMNDTDVVLTAIVKGAHSFSRGKSLHFNIDGEIVSYEPIDSTTDIETSSGFYGSGMYIPPSNWSSKRYAINVDFIERLVSAERVIIKIDLSKSYVEGVFSSSAPTTARSPFREFHKRLSSY